MGIFSTGDEDLRICFCEGRYPMLRSAGGVVAIHKLCRQAAIEAAERLVR